jgi:glycosyltransferase involved in cell wall biosynthesis
VRERRVKVAAIRSCDCGIQGPENLILMLAERLRGSRFDHLIVNLWDGEPLRVALHEEAIRRGLASEVVATRWDYDPGVVVKLRRVLQREQVDMVHTYGAKAEVATLLARPGLGIPLVGSYFGCFPMWPLRVQLAEATSLVSLRFFRRVLANSGTLKDELVRFGFRAGRVDIIPSYVDTSEIYPATVEQRRTARAALGLPDGVPVLIQLARLHPEKGHRYMLRAMLRVLQAHPQTIYLAVGEGWLLEDLRREAVELGVAAHVRFTGYYPDRLEALRAADLMVVPSVRDGMSVGLLEGMATGLPIVATRVYGSQEAVADGEMGYLVTPGDPAALADATITLLRDLPAARAMGAAARRAVEARFSADHVAAEIMRSYDAALGLAGVTAGRLAPAASGLGAGGDQGGRPWP